MNEREYLKFIHNSEKENINERLYLVRAKTRILFIKYAI